MHEHIRKLEAELMSEQAVIKQSLEIITENQMNLARLCNKILKNKGE